MPDPSSTEVEAQGRRRRRKARIECRQEHHRFGSAQPVGGGIVRRICDACGSISIDLTEVDDAHLPALFQARMSALDPAR